MASLFQILISIIICNKALRIENDAYRIVIRDEWHQSLQPLKARLDAVMKLIIDDMGLYFASFKHSPEHRSMKTSDMLRIGLKDQKLVADCPVYPYMQATFINTYCLQQ